MSIGLVLVLHLDSKLPSPLNSKLLANAFSCHLDIVKIAYSKR